MKDHAHIPDLLPQLEYLLSTNTLPDTAQRNGTRLANRLGSAVRVVLLGPQGVGKTALHEVLSTQVIPDTSFAVASTDTAPSFDQVDIAVWCTADFNAQEMAIWQSAPNRLKDHSFLVPIATATPLAPEQLDTLMDVAGQEFHALFPVTLAANDNYQTVTTLASEIARLVRSGRLADHDNAMLFLETHRGLFDASDPPEPPTIAPPELPNLNGDAPPTNLYQQALMCINERIPELISLPLGEDSADIDTLLTLCRETSEALADVFSTPGSDDPDFLLLQEDVLCASDKLLLMSMEGGVAPAVAAVTTLLQTRRDLEVRVA